MATATDLAEKLGRLYNASMVNVFNHVNANANKSQTIGVARKLGKLPEYYQPEWIYEVDDKNGTNETRRSSALKLDNQISI